MPKEPGTELQARFNKLWDVREQVLEPHELLLQAKALVLCALPYRRVEDIRITRRAQIGKDAWIAVTFAAVGEGAELPFGADRALLGWIQTQAYHDGFIEFATLKEFLGAFGLSDGGLHYKRFRARVERLSTLSVTVQADLPDEILIKNIPPIREAFFPKTSKAARARLGNEESGQLLMIPERYGFRLDPDFWAYLKANPVPLPLPLMRLFHAKPKAWDFTQFVLYRCYAAKSRSVVPWRAFYEQLGSSDKDHRRLKFTLKKILGEIQVVYPDLPATFLEGYKGLEVAPWKPRQAA